MVKCLNPWNFLVVEANGDCFFCCVAFLKEKYAIGNIFEDDLNTIWNGERAKIYRQDFLDGKYSFCNVKACHFCYERYYDRNNVSLSLTADLPKFVHLSYDHTCSQRCIFCRDKHNLFSTQELEKWNSVIDSHLLPLLSNAEILSLNGAGEMFDSSHSMFLVSKIIEKYPNIKFEIYTNGINCSKENIEKLRLTDRIKTIHISINSATRETFKKIFRSDNFEKVKNNIIYLNSLKQEQKIKDIFLSFIVNEVNYKDMKPLMKLIEDLDVFVSFSATHSSDSEFTQKEESYAIFKPTHYLHNEFIKVINDPIFKSPKCALDFDTNLKPIPFNKVIVNYLKRFIK